MIIGINSRKNIKQLVKVKDKFDSAKSSWRLMSKLVFWHPIAISYYFHTRTLEKALMNFASRTDGISF